MLVPWLSLPAMLAPATVIHDSTPPLHVGQIPGSFPTMDDSVNAIVVDQSNGDVLVTGASQGEICGLKHTTSAEQTEGDAFVSRYSSDGRLQWMRMFGNTGEDSGVSIKIGSFSDVYVLSAEVAGSGFSLHKYSSIGERQGTFTVPGNSPPACSSSHCTGMAVSEKVNSIGIFYHQSIGDSDACHVARYTEEAGELKTTDADWFAVVSSPSATSRFQCKCMDHASRSQFWVAGMDDAGQIVVLLLNQETRQVQRTFVMRPDDGKATVRTILASAGLRKGLPYKFLIGGYTSGSFRSYEHENAGKEDGFVASVFLTEPGHEHVTMQFFATNLADVVTHLVQDKQNKTLLVFGLSTGHLDTSALDTRGNHPLSPFVARLPLSLSLVSSISQPSFSILGKIVTQSFAAGLSSEHLYFAGIATSNELISGQDAFIEKLAWDPSQNRYNFVPHAHFRMLEFLQFQPATTRSSVLNPAPNTPVINVPESFGQVDLQVQRKAGGGPHSEMCGQVSFSVSMLEPGAFGDRKTIGGKEVVIHYARMADVSFSRDEIVMYRDQ